MAMNQQSMLFARVIEYLESQEWRYQVQEEDTRVTFNMGLKGKLASSRVIVRVSPKEIQAFAYSPLNATRENYDNVVEFLTRANYGLKIGKFEFDYSDGEIRFQTCLPCSIGIPSLKDVERVVDISFLMLQRYGDGLVKNLMGMGDPKKDIEDCERS